jgi:hypothetical protein
MLARIATAVSLAVALALAGGPATASATATDDEVRSFRGEGYSSMGLAYYWAFGQALQNASAAGFGECGVVDSYTSPGGYEAWVVVDCVPVNA